MNEINRLWDKWVADHTPTDVDEIVAYYRKQLAMYDSGVKPKRAEVEHVDMSQVLKNINQRTGTVAKPKPKAPTGKGLRRL